MRPSLTSQVQLPADCNISEVFFGTFEVKKAQPDKNMAMDLNHMKRLIDGNTVAIVGSLLS